MYNTLQKINLVLSAVLLVWTIAQLIANRKKS